MDTPAPELQILGTPQLLVNGAPIRLEPRLLTVLVIAATRGGRVAFDELANRFGTGSQATLRSFGAKLRKSAGFEVVKKNVRNCVQLALRPDQVDLWRFRNKVKRAKGQATHQKLPLLAEAAMAWSGPPLAGLSPRWVSREMTELLVEGRQFFQELIRLCAEEKHLAQAVTYAERADELFFGDEDIRSTLWQLWSRDGQAQSIMNDLRRREAGLDESDPLAAELRAEATSLAEEALRLSEPAQVGAPHQLPPAKAYLHGREADLAVLDQLIDSNSWVRVVTVCGMGGLGKTDLAVTWAHRVVDHFPDGVVFVDLRGFSSASPVEPEVALTTIARQLRIPGVDRGDDDALAAYRTAMNTRAVLVVIDNAVDHRHVVDLVAAGDRSRTVITTRTAVTTPAVVGGRLLSLRGITDEASMDILREVVGVGRVKAEPFAAADLVGICKGIPLAIRLVAAQANLNEGSTLKEVAVRLGSAAKLLGAKPDGETVLRESVRLSYAPLSAAAATTLQVIAIHPGPSITMEVIAFLTGLPAHVVHDAVDELRRGNLLEPMSDNGYPVHDLVRAFAAERAVEDRHESGVAELRERLLGFLLAAARQCDRALGSGRELPDDLAAPQGAPLPEPEDDAEGRDWFDREHRTLVMALSSPDFHQFTVYRWRLALALACYQTRNGYWKDAERLLSAACTIEKDELDERERVRYQAVCHRVLGNIQRKLRKFGVAERNLAKSIILAESIGEPLEVANGHQQMGVLKEDMEQWASAREHALTAGDLYGELADERGVAATLPTEIHCHLRLGEPERALDREAYAVEVMARASTPYNQGALYRVLMSCHMLLERYPDAVSHGEAARACYVESRATINEARVLAGLAEAYRAVGRAEGERDALLSCVAIYKRLEDKEAEDRGIHAAAERRLAEVTRGA